MKAGGYILLIYIHAQGILQREHHHAAPVAVVHKICQRFVARGVGIEIGMVLVADADVLYVKDFLTGCNQVVYGGLRHPEILHDNGKVVALLDDTVFYRIHIHRDSVFIDMTCGICLSRLCAR